MKLTIVADDQCVGVDGEFFAPLNLTQLDPTIHAVQWYGDYGEVEYKTRLENGVLMKPVNLLITDVTPFQFAFDAWDTAKAADVEEKARTTSNIPVTEV
jgi:hypothetical protein